MKRAFITGITGQDGSYLAELLLDRDYEVHGFARRGSRVTDPRVRMHFGDLADPAALRHALGAADPHEIYNLGAQSHVGASFTEPAHTWRVTAEPVLTILEHVRSSGVKAPWPRLRVYQASSSEMFGTEPSPQNEETRFSPQSPYAIAKLAAHESVGLYRRAYGMFAVGGILLNHESPRRGVNFVTRKITQAVARIKKGIDKELLLGNLDARRDWGFAGDYVEAMWRMLQQDEPRDLVVATGETRSLEEFLGAAFDLVGLDWRDHVDHDPALRRPTDLHGGRADPSRAAEVLGWRASLRMPEVVRRMVEARTTRPHPGE